MFLEILTLVMAKGSLATVTVIFTPDCPVSLDARPQLLKSLEATDVRWRLIVIDANTRPESEAYTRANPALEFIWEKTARSAREAGFDRVPAVTVVSADGTLQYRGAMASKRDAYGRIQFYLGDVLARIRSGQPINVRERPVEGCQLPQDVSIDIPPMRPSTPLGETIRQACLPCHRTGGHAPFSLETSAQVRAWTPMIREVLQSGKMPPRSRWSETENASYVQKTQLPAPAGNFEQLLLDPVSFQPLAFNPPTAAPSIVQFKLHHAAPGNWTGALQSWRSQRIYQSNSVFVSGLFLKTPPRHLRSLVAWVVRNGLTVGYLGSWTAGQGSLPGPAGMAQSLQHGDTILFEWWSRPNWESDHTAVDVGFKVAFQRDVKRTLRVVEVASSTASFTVPVQSEHRLESVIWPPNAGTTLTSVRKDGRVILGSTTPPNWPEHAWFSGESLKGPSTYDFQLISQSGGSGVHGSPPPIILPAPKVVRFLLSRAVPESP